MKRWKATCEGKQVLVYAKDSESARQSWIDKECDITEHDDSGHLELIEGLKKISEFIGSFSRGNNLEELYRFPYWGGDILVRLSKDLSDDHYYDLCRYQERDSRLSVPITWGVCDIQSFCSKYKVLDSVVVKEQGYVVTTDDIRRIKAQRFYNKSGEVYWRDADGYFYFADKHDLPCKKSVAEWEMYHDRPEAVLVECFWGLFHTREIHWWLSMEEFLSWYRSVAVSGTPARSRAPEYNIIKTGYRKLPPGKRKVIFRLPYYPVDSEDKSPERIAASWNKLVNTTGTIDMTDTLVDIVKRWKDYTERHQLRVIHEEDKDERDSL